MRKLQDFYKARTDSLRNQKDKMVLEISQKSGKNYLFNLKEKYHNLAIEDLVLNSKTKEYFRETKTGLMQKVAPIYKSPDFDYGRAHFLASEKRIFPFFIKTLWFDVGIIWLMSVFLYLALYFNWFRKTINVMSNILPN
jgi:hypothetical protein